jgi:hypothetical protein
MLVTEREAGERRCPHRGYMGEPSGFCLASMCMAWRWGPPVTEEAPAVEGGPPPGDGWSFIGGGFYMRRTTNPRGYCGLAGNPGEST